MKEIIYIDGQELRKRLNEHDYRKNITEISFLPIKNNENIDKNYIDKYRLIYGEEYSGSIEIIQNNDTINIYCETNDNKIHLRGSLEYLLSFCSKLESLDLSNIDTSNVTDMHCMFYECKSIKNLDLSIFNTGNVIDISSMFSGCKNLENLNISNFDTSNVTDMEVVFFNCSSLRYLDLSNFNTHNVKNMHGMFEGCVNLEYLDISNFDINNVIDIEYLFYGCDTDIETNNINILKVYNRKG